MKLYRLAVLGLPPMRSTYFRTLEILPVLALVGLWKNADLTWASGIATLSAATCLYAITPLILMLQRSRWRAELAQKRTHFESRIAQELDPVKRQWLCGVVEELPLRYHLADDPEPTYQRCRRLAQVANIARKIASCLSKN
jgi:hypothetical protein